MTQGGRVRQPKNPFTLTENERLLLAMYRAGKTYKEIKVALGYSPNTHLPLSEAIDKERLRLLDKRKGDSRSSLSFARGHIRMEGTK